MERGGVGLSRPGPPAPGAVVAGLAEKVRPSALARDQRLPVLPPLEALVGGGLRRGGSMAVAAAPGVTGATSLALALAARASQAGSWVAAVGLPSLGLVAAAELGVALDRLVLVADPGRPEREATLRRPTEDVTHMPMSSRGWASVVAALIDGFDIVLVNAGRESHLRVGDVRRLVGRVRERGAVLVAVGGELPGERSPLRLMVERAAWDGLGAGWGHLSGRRVTVVATGRGEASRPRRTSLWLPGPDGAVAAVVELAAHSVVGTPSSAASSAPSSAASSAPSPAESGGPVSA